MSTIKPIDLATTSQHIYPFYRPLFQVVIDEYLIPQEQIVFAANSTRHTVVDQEGISIGKMIVQDYDISTHKDVILNEPTLLIITNFRWVRVTLDSYNYSHKVRIRDKTSTLGKLFSGEKLKYYWLIPREDPEGWFKKIKSSPQKYITQQIHAFPLSDIYPQLKARRTEYTLHDEKAFPGGPFHLMLVSLKSMSYSLQYENGLKLQELLQVASINHGKLPLINEKPHIEASEPKETIVQKLESLKQLLDKKLITEEEYREKKEELLARM